MTTVAADTIASVSASVVMTRPWFTSRISACGIFADAYGRVPPFAQEEMRTVFAQLSRDDTPMVRRAASEALTAFAEVVEAGVIVEHLTPLFTSLSQDSQDSVKLLSVDSCVAVAKRLDDEAKRKAVLPVVLALAADGSYRVRWSVASRIVDLAQEAERLGCDSVWSAEAWGSDAFTPLAWIGAHTSRIKLGTSIAQIAARTPTSTAMTPN